MWKNPESKMGSDAVLFLLLEEEVHEQASSMVRATMQGWPSWPEDIHNVIPPEPCWALSYTRSHAKLVRERCVEIA